MGWIVSRSGRFNLRNTACYVLKKMMWKRQKETNMPTVCFRVTQPHGLVAIPTELSRLTTNYLVRNLQCVQQANFEFTPWIKQSVWLLVTKAKEFISVLSDSELRSLVSALKVFQQLFEFWSSVVQRASKTFPLRQRLFPVSSFNLTAW